MNCEKLDLHESNDAKVAWFLMQPCALRQKHKMTSTFYKLLTKIFHTLLLKRINRIHTLCSFWSQRKGETLALAGFTYIDNTTLLLLFRFVKKLPSFNSRNRTALRPLLILHKTNYFAQKKIWQDTKKVTNNSSLIFFSGNSQRTPSKGLQCLLYFNGCCVCPYIGFSVRPWIMDPKLEECFFLWCMPRTIFIT